MFAVDHVLISDAVLDAPFACHLGGCLGACCVHGDSGAPLEPEERADLEAVLPIVESKLRPEARQEIARNGVWEGNEEDGYGTTTVRGRECVFVVYEGAVAKCAVQNAFWEGKVGFEKPISCHLYPIRVEHHGSGDDAVEVLNYERIDLCKPAIPHGTRTGMQLADYLERPLSRRYGVDWYARFSEALDERRAQLGIGPQESEDEPASKVT